MKNHILLFLVLFIGLRSMAQHMNVKQFNFYDFPQDVKSIPPALEKESSPEAKKHPEYGILPFNAQCTNCVELVDKRTEDSRYFIDKDTTAKIYVEKSYFPLHYKSNENDVWHTIDYRLRPDYAHPGVYTAMNQPIPTKCDLNRKSASLNLGYHEFEFSHDLTMYYFDENKVYSKPEKGNYDNYKIGMEGLLVRNIWPGMDMMQKYREGQVETDYVVREPLKLPIDKGYLVIEDHFTLPDGFTIRQSKEGEVMQNGYFAGDYIIGNGKGEEVLYRKPAYFDARAVGLHGAYNLIKNGNECTLQVMVPVSWLNMPGNTYPLFIDPWVLPDSAHSGHSTDGGAYQDLPSPVCPTCAVSGPPSGYKFSTRPASCNDTLKVTFPGGVWVVEAYTEVEYRLTYFLNCGTPPEPAPYCTFSQVTQQVINNTCGTTSGVFQCNPAVPPFTGTCTTDSNLVRGAHPIRINNFVPNYLSCIAPQCNQYILPFTLENQDSTCGDICGTLCAVGNIWVMTVIGYRVIGNIDAVGYPPNQNTFTVCAGQTINFQAEGKWGVPPYRFLWTTNGGSTYDTTYSDSANSAIFPLLCTDTTGYTVTCVVVDTCGFIAPTSVFTVNVLTSPPTNAGPDKKLCAGGKVTIGGNPTTPANDTIVGWTGENAMVTSWLSDTSAANPVVTVPAGTVDTFYYAVETTNGYCQNTDTVFVYSNPKRVVTVDSGGPTAICPGYTVPLLATPGFLNYVWSNGAGDSIVTVGIPGTYYVIAVDSNGCTDTSNSITVTNIGPPPVHVYPDTTIVLGDSVVLNADIPLVNNQLIDSFYWYPPVNLSCLVCDNPVAAPTSIQQYNLRIYKGGCYVSDSLLIQVVLPTNFYIPNAFTPGKPGDNDEFYIYCQSGVRVVSFQVYDRWGEKVHDGPYPWDGTFKDKAAPQGVYVYDFKLSLYGNQNLVFRKGSVTLIR